MKHITIIGAGLFGSVCAYELVQKGYDVTVIDKRNHIGGNCYTEEVHNIVVHKYGAHVFHSKNKMIWQYVNQFAEFNNFVNKVFSNYKGKIYSIPFNLLTYHQVFGNDFSIPLTQEQKDILVEMFIKNYSEKHWKQSFENIPVDILSRLPIRYSYNNDYFENQYQGIPIGGYTQIFEKMLKSLNLILNEKFELTNSREDIIFTGCIDELFGYQFGKLNYRSIDFREEYLPDVDDFQHNTVINYPEKEVPFTRIIEHKHFEFNQCKGTLITREYPLDDGEPCYPFNDENNQKMYEKYYEYSKQKYPNIKFGGRLGLYRYLDMDQAIEEALKLVSNF